MIDRDAQTVARWEKSSEVLPKFVDLTIRTRFAAKFDQTILAEPLQDAVDVGRRHPRCIGKIGLGDRDAACRSVCTARVTGGEIEQQPRRAHG